MLTTDSLYHVPYHNEVAKLAIALNFYKLFTILLRHDDAVNTMHEGHNAVYVMHEAHNAVYMMHEAHNAVYMMHEAHNAV
jgi:hypothetical protein